jgi:hypothetical protein
MVGVSPSEEKVNSIAASQAGILTRRQALDAGMTEEMIKQRVSSGRWYRMKPGLYAVAGSPPHPHGLLVAATAALRAVVSHESAAELLDLPAVPRGRLVVTVPFRKTHRFPGVTVHQSTDLDPVDVVMIDDLPSTNTTRTIIDLAAVLGARRLERVIDHCLSSRELTYEELESRFDQLARRGKRGILKLREILKARGPGHVAPQTELEHCLHELLIACGLPEPESQHPLPWPSDQDGRVDFAYPGARLIIEADSRRWHTLAEAFERDRHRDNLAVLSGWRVLRFTWQQIKETPEEVCRAVRDALSPKPGNT